MAEYVTEFNWDSVDEFGNPWFVTRERVVRCRDCAMYDEDECECLRDPNHTGRGWPSRPSGFCAWGVPREDET